MNTAIRPHPPAIGERLLLLAMVFGNVTVALSMINIEREVDIFPADDGFPWIWPMLFLASAGCILGWVAFPESRRFYACSGAITAGAYLSRGMLAMWTIPSTDKHWAAALGMSAWFICAILVGISWGRMRPARRR